MTAPEPRVTPTRYEVSCLPDDHEAASHLTLRVEYRGRGRWAVVRPALGCLSRSGQWDGEPTPSERDDAWLQRHRFDLDEALTLAKEYAPTLTVNGWTVAQVLADIEDDR